MKDHICIKCNKVYASRQSLWNHKKTCKENVRELFLRKTWQAINQNIRDLEMEILLKKIENTKTVVQELEEELDKQRHLRQVEESQCRELNSEIVRNVLNQINVKTFSKCKETDIKTSGRGDTML